MLQVSDAEAACRGFFIFILIFVADQVSDLKLFGLNCGVFVLNAIEKGDFLLLT